MGRRARTLRANALVLGQLAGFLDDGQVAVVPPRWTGPDPSADRAWAAWRSLDRRFAFEMIGAILGRGFFAFTTEELILELAVLSANLFELGCNELF